MMDIKEWSISFLIKKVGSEGIANRMLAQELNKPGIKTIKRRKLYARLRDNIWAADLAEMGLLSSKNKSVKYLLCVIGVFIRYAWVRPFKDKKLK